MKTGKTFLMIAIIIASVEFLGCITSSTNPTDGGLPDGAILSDGGKPDGSTADGGMDAGADGGKESDGGKQACSEKNPSIHNWNAATMSADGTILAIADSSHTMGGGYIYISYDSGNSWVKQTSTDSQKWSSIAMSSDGTKMVAVGYKMEGPQNYSSYIFTSSDSGNTWICRVKDTSENRFWTSIASSSNGAKLASTTAGGYIYTSDDNGATWTQQTQSGIRNWHSIASSSDGDKLSAAVWYGYVYTSSDSGVNWTEHQDVGSGSWRTIASSSDGVKLFVVSGGTAGFGAIYSSINSGSEWINRTPGGLDGAYTSCAVSSDGENIAATHLSTSEIITSQDEGLTWTSHKVSDLYLHWIYVASSSDGHKLVVLSAEGNVFTSIDSGTSWTERGVDCIE